MATYTAKVIVGGSSPFADTPAGRKTVLPFGTGNVNTITPSNDIPVPGLSSKDRAAFGADKTSMPSPHAPRQSGALLVTVTGTSFDDSAISSRKMANDMGYMIEIGAMEVRDAGGVVQTRANLLALL